MEPCRYSYRVQEWDPFDLKPDMFEVIRSNDIPTPEILLLKQRLGMTHPVGLNFKNIQKFIPSMVQIRHQDIRPSSRQHRGIRNGSECCNTNQNANEKPASPVSSSEVSQSSLESDNQQEPIVSKTDTSDRNGAVTPPTDGEILQGNSQDTDVTSDFSADSIDQVPGSEPKMPQLPSITASEIPEPGVEKCLSSKISVSQKQPTLT